MGEGWGWEGWGGATLEPRLRGGPSRTAPFPSPSRDPCGRRFPKPRALPRLEPGRPQRGLRRRIPERCCAPAPAQLACYMLWLYCLGLGQVKAAPRRFFIYGESETEWPKVTEESAEGGRSPDVEFQSRGGSWDSHARPGSCVAGRGLRAGAHEVASPWQRPEMQMLCLEQLRRRLRQIRFSPDCSRKPVALELILTPGDPMCVRIELCSIQLSVTPLQVPRS
ncbi:uncharacterized protein PS065_014859 isoform 2-T2 [Dugong dugon]